MGLLLSVNSGKIQPIPGGTELTGHDKRPVAGPHEVFAPGPSGVGGSGLAGDELSNLKSHGGNDQAIYAYAREELDEYERELDKVLRPGSFGENLTTVGIDVTGARIGERWRIGDAGVELEVTSPRIPCSKFQGCMNEKHWVKRFTQHGKPGAYLRVLTPGVIQAGDQIEVVHRPAHEVSIGVTFRALTTNRELLPQLHGIDAASDLVKGKVAELTRRG